MTQKNTFAPARSIALLVVAGALFGCASRTPIDAPAAVAEPLPQPQGTPYLIKPGDLVAIRFWGNVELDEEVLVRPDGRISLPFIDEVEAAGLTTQQLDQELTRRYTGELTQPQITVILRQATSERVYVGGEVASQGAIELSGPKTLFQAIQEAGGFLPSARRKDVLLIRSTPDGRVARAVNLMPVLSGATPEADPQLQASDIVFVPRTKITNVNYFIEQYINRLLPIRPVGTIQLFGDPLFEDEDPIVVQPPADGGTGEGDGGEGGGDGGDGGG